MIFCLRNVCINRQAEKIIRSKLNQFDAFGSQIHIIKYSEVKLAATESNSLLLTNDFKLTKDKIYIQVSLKQKKNIQYF